MATAWDKMSDAERQAAAVAAVAALVRGLDGPDDVYKQVVLEEVFRWLMEGAGG